jgi:hypothetical protein
VRSASAVSIVEFGAVFLVGELKVETVVFAGVFENSEGLDVVFLWSSCGGMCGKRGQWEAVFRG